MKLTTYLTLGIIVIAFFTSFFYYKSVPYTMATHWDLEGNVNGYMGKSVSLFLIPFMMLGFFMLFSFLPSTKYFKDSKRVKKNEQYLDYYDGFLFIFSLYLLFIHLFIILWNINIQINLTRIFPLGIGLFVFYIGIIMGKAKPNWFVGIRTYWTLRSDTVWYKTHALGEILFKVMGVIIMFAFFYPESTLIFIIVSIFFLAISLILYSYVEYKKENHTN